MSLSMVLKRRRGVARHSHRIERSKWMMVGASAIAVAIAATAQSFDQGPVWVVTEENDLVVDTDRHYTQGIKVSYLQRDGVAPNFAKWISEKVPTIGYEAKTIKFGYQVGQNMYTPADLDAVPPSTSERPYAGWLYTGLILQRRGLTSSSRPVLESFQIDVGVIGPASLAEHAQKWVHQIRGFSEPAGWGSQLRNEPGVALKYSRTYLLRSDWEAPFQVDFLPSGGVSLGNVETSARVGGLLRFGWHVPEHFGFQLIDSLSTTEGGISSSSPSRWGCYAFAGAEAKSVFYSTFINGNLFRGGPDVEREWLVGDFKVGVALVLKRVELAATYIRRTPEYRSQIEEDGFGSLVAKIAF